MLTDEQLAKLGYKPLDPNAIAVWCNDCAWSGTVGDLALTERDELCCPECYTTEYFEVDKIYFCNEEVRRQIKELAYLVWWKVGKCTAYDIVNAWLKKSGEGV